MANARRIGSENSETRSALLDITERIMVEDGYAAVSSRRVATDAGVTPALVHYYFARLDDLFLAVFRRRAEEQFARLQQFLNSPQPLRALWEFSREPTGTAWLMEFMALANHRKVIGKEIAFHVERFRRLELEILSDRFEEYGLEDVPPVAVLVLITSLSRTIVQEQAIRVRTGLSETIDLVERYLQRVEGAPEPRARKRARATRRKRASRTR